MAPTQGLTLGLLAQLFDLFLESGSVAALFQPVQRLDQLLRGALHLEDRIRRLDDVSIPFAIVESEVAVVVVVVIEEGAEEWG